MAHDILRFASTIFNTPQLITQESFDPIVAYLSERIKNPEMVVFKKEDTSVLEKDDLEIIGNIGVIDISGSLSYKPVYTMCGEIGTSYVKILDQTERMIAAGVEGIVFQIGSGGGEASHLFTYTDDVRNLLDESGVWSVAYVDTHASSAAYAWAVVADEVIVHPSASVGSVGCVVCLTDFSKAKEKEGIKPIYVVSTKGKVPFNEDGSFSESFISKLQEDVDRLGNQFAQHVSNYTGLSVDEVLATDAGMFHAEKAVEIGFANKIMTHKEFGSYLSTKEKGAKRA